MQVVIDTNIWKKACTSESMNCVFFIGNFLQTKGDHLAVDYDYKMLKEYEDNVNNEQFYQQCIKELYRQSRIAFGSSNLNNVHENGLDGVGFHEPEDRVFLGRAYNGDKYLVSEDSDYGLSPDPEKNDAHALAKKNYIETVMGVTLADSEKALSDSRNRMIL